MGSHEGLVGVLEGFVEYVDNPAHLVLAAGPAGPASATTPRGGCLERDAAWTRLPRAARPASPGRDPNGRPGRERARCQCTSAPGEVVRESPRRAWPYGRGGDVEVAAGRASAVGGNRRPGRGRRDRSPGFEPHDLGPRRRVERPWAIRPRPRASRKARTHIAEHFLGDRHRPVRRALDRPSESGGTQFIPAHRRETASERCPRR